MRIQLKRIAAGIMIGILSLSLTGCFSKPTVESVLGKAHQAATGINSGTIEYNLHAKVIAGAIGEKSSDIEITYTGEISGDKEKGIYLKAESNFNSGGEHEEGVAIEQYHENDGDNIICYSYGDFNTYFFGDFYKRWHKITYQKDTFDYNYEKLKSTFLSSIKDKLALSDKEEKYNDRKAYHIYGEIKGPDMKEIIKDIAKTIFFCDITEDVFKKIDLGSLICDMDFYFDKKTGQMLGCKFDFTKSNVERLIKNIQYVENDEMTFREKEEIDSLSVDCEDLSISVTVNNINNYLFGVPDRIKSNAKDID